MTDEIDLSVIDIKRVLLEQLDLEPTEVVVNRYYDIVRIELVFKKCDLE